MFYALTILLSVNCNKKYCSFIWFPSCERATRATREGADGTILAVCLRSPAPHSHPENWGPAPTAHPATPLPSCLQGQVSPQSQNRRTRRCLVQVVVSLLERELSTRVDAHPVTPQCFWPVTKACAFAEMLPSSHWRCFLSSTPRLQSTVVIKRNPGASHAHTSFNFLCAPQGKRPWTCGDRDRSTGQGMERALLAGHVPAVTRITFGLTAKYSNKQVACQCPAPGPARSTTKKESQKWIEPASVCLIELK